MILHFLEVWLLFLLVFAVGCGLGVLLHNGLAAGPLAGAQESFAGAVGGGIDRLKWRLGIAPEWRPEFHPSPSWPEPREDEYPALAEDSARTQAEGHEWIDDDPSAHDEWPEDVEPAEDDVVADVERALREEDPVRPDGADRDDTLEAEEESGALDMMRPAALASPRAGVPDNLQRIWGIGKRNEALLYSLGIFHFGQIAAWTPAEARWVAARLTFPERLERDNWIGQATVLATGGDPSAVSPSNRVEEDAQDQGET